MTSLWEKKDCRASRTPTSANCSVSDFDKKKQKKTKKLSIAFLQSSGVLKYTNCFSAEGLYSPNECPGHETKQFDSKSPVILELWRRWSATYLLSRPGPPWPGVVAPDRVLSMG